jgi:CRISPR-associated exonuclease Cas4
MAFAVVLLVLALVLLFLAARLRARASLPAGDLIYSDTGAWRRNDRALFSKRYALTGKPDYLIDAAEAVIPVEVKSGRAPARPREGHVLQLAAYCLLVEDQLGATVSKGLIRYDDRHFVIAFDDTLRRRLFAALDDMRGCFDQDGAARNHTDPRRCMRCGLRESCDERLS